MAMAFEPTGRSRPSSRDDPAPLMVTLRNEFMPAFGEQGWLNLGVRVAPTPPSSGGSGSASARTAKEDVQKRRKSTPRSRASMGPARFTKSAYDDAYATRRVSDNLMGSFAAGPSVIWREVPATEERRD